MLRYLRYVVLAWVIYMTAISATLFFDAYDPFSALFHFWTGRGRPGWDHRTRRYPGPFLVG